MPHAAIVVTGAFIVGVAAYTVYKELIQPTLEQRRRDEEEEWNAQELDRVMQLSIIEHQHEEQRRADQERWEQRQQAAHSTSSNARYDIDTPATMRRRRQADPFSDANEMQEVPGSGSRSSGNGFIFDAGPSSRLDSIAYDPPAPHREQPATESDELLETARSLSLTEEELAFVKNEDLLHSPRSSAGGMLQSYSVIEPDSRPASRFTPRSGSPLVVDVTSSIISESRTPPITGIQQDLTAESLQQAEAERRQAASTRAASPTPTLRSHTADELMPSHNSSSYVSASRAPSQASASHFRPISPFSEVGTVSAHSSDEDNAVTRPGAVLRGGGSDIDSQWSDLGEDSSDEEDAPHLNRL
ncbi:hypothetical protein P389DRAFT_195048 [Cystobasidium minutum MCA 4210]|uniref:uncharacterized protein n=1 Tax=Cystobasidium minutum MCA 4210 TaxID=1397322 RepID=UPI0034CDBA2F|eukprot:jgi/Rhomi1/195048/gm1.3262_g